MPARAPHVTEKGYMFISTYLVTDLRCRGLGFHRPDFRLQGLVLLQILLKLDRHTAYQQPGFCAVRLKTGFFPETGWFCASLAATVSQG
jgi:hypothetical protein